MDGTGVRGERTYKIQRVTTSPGLGYSRDITVKYGLTFEQLISLFKARGLVGEGSCHES